MKKTIYFKTPKIHQQAPGRRFFNFFKKIILLAILIGGIYIIFLTPFFRIETIIVQGNQQVSFQEIEERTNSVFKKALFPHHFLFISSENIKKAVEEIFFIKEVKVKKGWPNKIVLEIKERKPALIWQTEDPSLNKKEKYFIDEEGIVLKKASDLNLPLVIDKKKVPVEEGKKIVTSLFVNFVKDLYKNLPLKTSYTIKTLFIEEVTFDVEVQTEQGIFIIFSTNHSLEKQIERLEIALDEIKKRNDKISEYIDLRLKDKIFYK